MNNLKSSVVKSSTASLNSKLKYSKKIFLSTDYGKLMVLNQINSTPSTNINLTNNDTSKAELLKPTVVYDIEYITDNTSSNYLYSKAKEDKNYFLFSPSSYFGNSILVYKSLKKKMYEKYFGTTKKPLNPFSKCKTSSEVFHLSRNIKTSLNTKLGKIGYILYKNGDVNINHKENSILQNNINIKSILLDFIKTHENNIKDLSIDNDKFNKYDYFVPTRLYEGIISANSYIQKGIAIKVLGDKKIYPLYGVFSPTRQDYLELFDDFLKNNIKENKSLFNAVDLGCGTGVLSCIISQYGINRIFALDNNNNCILSTLSNAQALDCANKVIPVNYDLEQNYYVDLKLKNENKDKINKVGNLNQNELIKSKLASNK